MPLDDVVHLVRDPEPGDDDFAEQLRKALTLRAELDAHLEREIVADVDAGGSLDGVDKVLRELIALTYPRESWPAVFQPLLEVARKRVERNEALERDAWTQIEKSLEAGASAQARGVADDAAMPAIVQRRLSKWVDTWQSVVAEVDVGGSIASTEIMLRKQHVKALGKTNESVLNGWLHVAAKRIERNTIMTREAQAWLALKLDDGAPLERVLDELRTKSLPLDVRDTVVTWARSYASRRPQALE